MATITLSEYNNNPNAYVGQTTKFNGKFVSKTEVDDQGSFDAQVELDFLLSGAQLTEPIHILVGSKNMFKDELIPYEGQDKVLEFECLIQQKPPGYHSFKLVKTLWARDGFVSHNNRRGAGAQQVQQQLPVPQQTQQPSAAPPSFAQKAPIPQQNPGAGGFSQPQQQAPLYQPQGGTMYGQQPQVNQWGQQQAPAQQAFKPIQAQNSFGQPQQPNQVYQSGEQQQIYNSGGQPQMQFQQPTSKYQPQQGVTYQQPPAYGQPAPANQYGQNFQPTGQAYQQTQQAYGQQPQQAYGYQQQATPAYPYGQPTQTGYGQTQIGAPGYQQGFPPQQVQQGYLPQQRLYQAPPAYGQPGGFPPQPQYQQYPQGPY